MALLNLFKNSGIQYTGGLQDFNVGQFDDVSSDSAELVKITGRSRGLIAWILEKLKISDPTFALTLTKDFLIMSRGTKSFTIVPTKEIHTAAVGYGNQKLLLVIAGVLAILGLIAIFGEPASGLLMLILAFVFVFLFKYSSALEVNFQCMSEDRSRTSFGVRLKSSVTGQAVTEDQLASTLEVAKNVCTKLSKFY